MPAPGHSSFFRQNSSPAEFFSQLNSPSGLGCDEFGSSFINSLEFPPLPDIHLNKRSRERNSEQTVANLVQLLHHCRRFKLSSSRSLSLSHLAEPCLQMIFICHMEWLILITSKNEVKAPPQF
ncbi:hypothetical protein NE237_025664 [Protea cynaroides]|uniref:Uncharacterized protein n=1 Tax=Protea cynaroides TaxID=273540 RepID=A0A9Q0H5A8_9MAGN|nr:hypothetical protein NE237_025664 [Protea cynaroides]